MRFGILFFLLLFSYSCSQDPTSNLKPLNLLPHGVPLTILAPDSAEVKTKDMGIVRDISVTGGEHYSLQIFSAKAMVTDLNLIKKDQLEEVKSNPYFSKIIREEDKGFIYENAIDSVNTNYGFRYFDVFGDREVTIQNALIGIFSLEDIETMYRAVQPTAQ